MILTHSDKFSRTQVFTKLLAIKDGAELDTYTLDALINYFAPSVPKRPKDVFDWVAKAVADDRDVRTYLRYVYVENGEIVATDGHRMHIGETDLPNGYYCPKTRLRVDVYAKYPQYKRVIPKRANMKLAEEFSPGVKIIKKKEIFYFMVGDVAINQVYLNEALAKPGETYYDGNVAGDCEFGQFIIQGLRL